MTEFVTKDSGKRVEFDSGMKRDTQEGKPRYDLIPHAPLKRLAELYARGAEKYGAYNWQKANSQEELDRFKASAFRHFMQWLNGEVDEDHGIAVAWNIFAVIWLEEKLYDSGVSAEPAAGQSTVDPPTFRVGDRVHSASWGNGTIVKVSPAGKWVHVALDTYVCPKTVSIQELVLI